MRRIVRWVGKCVIQTATVAVALLVVRACPLAVSPDDPDAEWFASFPELETDRDAFTPATRTATEKAWIIESSYSYIDNRHDADINSLPETLVRYGLTRRIELRVGWNWEAGGAGNVVTAEESSEGLVGEGVSYESHMLYGVKLDVSQQEGLIPRSCAILEGFTPTSGSEPASQPVITYAGGWEFTNRWRLDAALRYAMGNEGQHSVQSLGAIGRAANSRDRTVAHARRVLRRVFRRLAPGHQSWVYQPRRALTISRPTSSSAYAWAGA